LAVCLLLYAAILVFNGLTSSQAQILQPSGIETGLQNYRVFYDKDNGFIYAATYRNILLVYNEAGEKQWELATDGPVNDVAFDYTTGLAYLGCDDRNIYVLESASGRMLEKIDLQRRVYKLDVKPGGDLIIVSSGVSASKNYIFLYDRDWNELLRVDMTTVTFALSFNTEYNGFVTGTNGGEITNYDMSGKKLKQVRIDSEIIDISDNEAGFFAFTKKGRFYAFDHDLNSVYIQRYQDYGDGMSMEMTPDGSWAGIGFRHGDFLLLDDEGLPQFTHRFDAQVTGIAVTNDFTYVTGMGDFFYRLDNRALMTIKQLTAIKQFLFPLVIAVPFILLFLLIMSVLPLRAGTKKFLITIYKHKTAYLLLIPTFALIFVFSYYPVALAFIRAFTDWNMFQQSTRQIRFNGFDNFRKMITEGYFLIGINNMFILLVTGILKTFTMPLLVAKLVFSFSNDRLKYWTRFAFVLPMVVPGIVSTLMWGNIYEPQVGMLNALLERFGFEHLTRVWLGEEATAIWAIVFMGFPFVGVFGFLVYYGGLISIPQDLFDAAKVDGCPAWKNFFTIQLPLIRPQMKLLLMLTFIGSIQDYGGIFLLTKGGPGAATYVPGLEMYYNATRFGQYGYACALGLVMFVAIFAGTLFNNRINANTDLA